MIVIGIDLTPLTLSSNDGVAPPAPTYSNLQGQIALSTWDDLQGQISTGVWDNLEGRV